MLKLVECIPNFSLSEARDPAGFQALVETAKSVPGCSLLDAQSDGSHNRTVLTMVGTPEAVLETAFQLTRRAAELIDMNHHTGEHSRMGATDVIPFVPQPVLPHAQMAVSVDQSRRHPFTGSVKNLCALRNRDVGAHGCNFAVID